MIRRADLRTRPGRAGRELVHIHATRCVGRPASGGEDVGELLAELADPNGELTPLLAYRAVLDECAVDTPVRLLQHQQHAGLDVELVLASSDGVDDRTGDNA